MPDDSVAVQLAHLRQRLEDQKVQTALKIISRHDDPYTSKYYGPEP
jgi:hypothetical protein